MKGRGNIGSEEREAVLVLMDECIKSGNMFGYQGAQEEAFCKEFAQFLGGGFADGVNSGTNSVYVAIKALQLPTFSEVIVGCMTDPGGIMPIVLNNCIPIVADTMLGSFNTGVAMIEPLITERTRAIVVAHIGGEPVNMPEIMALAKKHNMDEIHAVIGRVQIKKLPDIVARRKAFVRLLIKKGMDKLKVVKIPELAAWADHCYWWWKLRIDSSALNCGRDEFCAALVAEGLSINPSYRGALPASMTWFQNRTEKFPWNAPQYKGDPRQEFHCPNANKSVEDHFILFMYESWGEAEADAILKAIHKVEAVLAK